MKYCSRCKTANSSRCWGLPVAGKSTLLYLIGGFLPVERGAMDFIEPVGLSGFEDSYPSQVQEAAKRLK